MFSLKSKNFKSVQTLAFEKKSRYLCLELLREPLEYITNEVWFELFCYLIYIKKIIFLKKKINWLQSDLLLNSNSQSWTEISFAFAVCPNKT